MKRLLLLALCAVSACHNFDETYDDCVMRDACANGPSGGGGGSGGGTGGGGGSESDAGRDAGEPPGPDGGTPDGGGGLSFNLTTFDFGQSTLFESTTRQLEVTNDGAPLGFVSLMILGTNSGDFRVMSNNCTTPIPGNGLCTAQLVFSPTGVMLGQRSASLRVQGEGAPYTIPLTGEATAPFTLSASQLDFADINVSNTARQQLIATNHTGAQLVPMYLFTPMLGAFSKDGSCASVPANGTCTFDVIFSPSDAGTFTAGLTVSAMSDSKSFSAPDVSLRGNGVALGSVRLTQDPFGGLTADAGSVVFQGFTISNAASTPIGPISLSLSGSNAFSIVDAGCSTLPGMGSCGGLLRFAPTANAAYTGTLSADAGVAGVASTSLVANGFEAGRLQWVTGSASPTPPNPDVVGPTNMNVTHTYTLRNNSSGPTSSITFSISGTSAWRLEPPSTGQCTDGIILAPMAECTVSATFLAGQSGQAAATFIATLTASATNGGSATRTLNGTSAYTFTDGGIWGNSIPGNAGPPTGACTAQSAVYYEEIAAAPNGVQYQYFHESAFDAAKCTSNQWFFQIPARNSTHYPGTIRPCGSAMTWPSGDDSPTNVGDPYSWACLPPGTSDPYWGSGDENMGGTCNMNLTHIVRYHVCL